MGQIVKLSKRLETVASFVSPGSKIADVGTDHGYIPIALTERHIALGAIAMDIRPGPLERAQGHIRQHRLEGMIETRLSDGVEKLEAGEADTVIIAGMGGELVIHILEQGRRLWRTTDHWILSPQSELDKVRRYLWEQGFEICREAMVEEDGKYYTVMDAIWAGETETVLCAGPERVAGVKAEKGEAEGGEGNWRRNCEKREWTEARYLYGPRLIEEKNPVLAEFLDREEQQLTGIVKGLEGQEGTAAAARRNELERKLDIIRNTIQELRDEAKERFRSLDCQETNKEG